VEALLAAVAAGDPRGQTANAIATALHRTDGEQVQQELEDLVAQGLLERQGVGRGALYVVVSS
jgi:predicted ArsR family transcriptional regulator